MASDGDMLDEEAVEEGVDRRRWESDTARMSVSKTSGSVIILTLRRGRIFRRSPQKDLAHRALKLKGPQLIRN